MSDQPKDTKTEPSPAEIVADIPAAGARVGRYVIIGPVGHGGQAVVLLAYDPELDRRVALKLLHVARLLDAAKQRLLREAQALARLSHPNVVPVYDVGTVGDDAFVAMEYVEGETLDSWLQEPRPLAEILARLRQAGRGLAAAHDAGLIHRDFKPANVLIGRDGRVRVVDFGLARSVEDAEPAAPSEELGPEDSARRRQLQQVTRDDHVVGTPAYMAPEQEANGTCDARADQYSFGVTLYRALSGRLPGDTHDTMTAATADEHAGRRRRRAPVAGRVREVPSWLQRIVTRALQVDPHDRFVSMHALLAALDRDPAAARRRMAAAGAVAALLALGAAVVVGQQRHERLRCQSGRGRIAAVWSETTAARVRGAFAAAPVAYGAALADAVVGQLDEYARRWSAMDDDACAATHVRGEQSEEALDLRTACLDRRRDELGALARALGAADAATVRHAGQAVESLTSLDVCADVSALRAEQPRPRSRAQADRVASLETRVAEVQARYAVGKAGDAVTLGSALLPDAAQAGYLPLVANLEHWLARSYSDLHDSKQAIAHFAASFAAALQAHADHLAAQAAVRLAQEELFAPDADHLARYRQWAAIGDGAIHRVGGDVSAELIQARVRCISMFDTGQIDDRLRCIADVVQQATEASRLTEWDVSMLGLANVDLGRFDEGLRWLERGVELSRKQLGWTHPRTLENRGFLCFAYDERGQPDKSLALCSAALADAQKSAPDQPFLLARLRLYLAQAQRWLGRFDEARATALVAAAAHEEDLAPDLEQELGLDFDGQGRHDEAIEHLRAAVALDGKALPADHPNVILARLALGEALLHAGDREGARQTLEAAAKSADKTQLSPLSLADVRFAWARALPPEESARAKKLAAAARRAYDAAPPTPRYRDRVAAMDAWLTAR